MWAFISDNYKCVVSTQQKLDLLISFFPRSNFKRIEDMKEARDFWKFAEKKFFSTDIVKLSHKSKYAYLTIEYFIDNNNIYINMITKNLGFIKFSNLPSNISQEVSYDLLKLKISNVVLDDSLIAHHCVAICNILRLIGPLVNVELILPDVSVYLALTKYEGKNFEILRTRSELESRLGNVYFSFKR